MNQPSQSINQTNHSKFKQRITGEIKKNNNKGALSSKWKENKSMGFQQFQMCKRIQISVSIARTRSFRRTLSEWTLTLTRKKNMYVNIEHQLNHNSKRNVTWVSALQTFQRERKSERKCWQNGLLAHTYHSQTFWPLPLVCVLLPL